MWGRQRQVMKEESGDKEESIREMAAELERPKGSERELAVRLVGAENDRKQAEKSVDQASQVEEVASQVGEVALPDLVGQH